MPRCVVFWAWSSTTRLASAGTPPLKRATTEQRRAPFDLGIAGIDLNVGGAGFGENRRARLGLRTGLAGQGDGDGDQERRGSPHGPVASTRSFQVGTVSSQSCVRRWSRAWRMTADCKKPSRPAGVAASSSTAASRPVPSSGCLASMRRATQRESRTDRRATSAHPTPLATTRPSNASSQPSGISFSPELRTDQPEAHAGQGPDEPAERQPAPEPRVPEAAARPVPMLAGVRCSCRQGLRAKSSGSDRWFAPPARFRRSRCRWPRGSATARVSGGLRARRYTSAEAARGRHSSGYGSPDEHRTARSSRRAAARSCSPADRDSRRKTTRRPACRSCRGRADRFRRRTPVWRAIVTAAPSGLWTIDALDRRRPRRAAAPGRRRVDWPRSPAAGFAVPEVPT